MPCLWGVAPPQGGTHLSSLISTDITLSLYHNKDGFTTVNFGNRGDKINAFIAYIETHNPTEEEAAKIINKGKE